MLRSCLLLLLAWPGLAAPPDTYLVFPFANDSGNASLDWLGESFSEALQTALAEQGILALDRDERVAGCQRLNVDPQAKLTLATMIRVAETLSASRLIYGEFGLEEAEGSGQPAKGGVRAVARVVDVPGRASVATLTDKGPLAAFGSLQCRMAWRALIAAQPSGPSLAEFEQRWPAIRLDALENYIRGLMAGDEDESHRYWAQAARLEEKYWPPRFYLGKLNWRRGNYRVAATWLAGIPAGHPRYLQAQFLTGLSRYATADFEAARSAFLTVAASTPVAEVLNNLGAAESRLNLPSALSRFQEALALDPADPDYNFNAGYLLWRGAQFEAAIGHLSRALEAAGEDDEAELLLERARMRSGHRRQDPRTGGLERLKESFPESAWRHLKLLVSRSGR